jgi:hypothetical protein
LAAISNIYKDLTELIVPPIVCTDRSGELVVQMDAIPALIVGDTLQLSAHVLSAGDTLSNAGVSFGSNDVTVVLVSEEGRLFASNPGRAEVSASALTFQGAQNATQVVEVRDVYELDSIAPRQVRYGSVVDLFGVGLTQTLTASFGGAEAIFHSYTPQQPGQLNRFGKLSLWVTPPAPTISQAVLLGFEGLLISDSILVVQRDIYEPNDSVPTQFGSITDSIYNPALAFERVRRNDGRLGVDWYTFTTTTPGDWTVTAWSPAGGSRFDVYLTNSLFFSSAALDAEGIGLYAVAPGDWGSGAGFRPCDGMGFRYPSGEHAFSFEVPPDSAVMALQDLPAGTYHVMVAYGESGPFYDPMANVSGIGVFVDSLNLVTPLPTGLRIKRGYHSAILPDRFEENDYCSVAQGITVPSTVDRVNIDTPHDADWYKFSVATGANIQFTVDAVEEFADVDMYVIRDWRPDSLVVVDFGIGADATVVNVTEGVFLDPGAYLLLVVDFIGLPTEYTLSSEILPTLPPVPLTAQDATARLESQLRRIRSRTSRSTAKPVGGH